MTQDIDRLLSRLPAEERAQATEKLLQMRGALEHATKRLVLDLETAEEVRLQSPTVCHKPTHLQPTAYNDTRCIVRL
jgi:hypothetical protein